MVKDIYELVVLGYHFRVTTTAVGYEVDWLDVPDETFPSGFGVRAVGCTADLEPAFDENTIRAEIKHWLQTELSGRT